MCREPPPLCPLLATAIRAAGRVRISAGKAVATTATLCQRTMSVMMSLGQSTPGESLVTYTASALKCATWRAEEGRTLRVQKWADAG